MCQSPLMLTLLKGSKGNDSDFKSMDCDDENSASTEGPGGSRSRSSSDSQGRAASSPSQMATQVTEFLASISLGQYTQRFLAEGFDTMLAVSTLTAQDFAKLGVKLGHQRVLQIAVRGLAAGASTSSSRRSSSALSAEDDSFPPLVDDSDSPLNAHRKNGSEHDPTSNSLHAPKSLAIRHAAGAANKSRKRSHSSTNSARSSSNLVDRDVLSTASALSALHHAHMRSRSRSNSPPTPTFSPSVNSSSTSSSSSTAAAAAQLQALSSSSVSHSSHSVPTLNIPNRPAPMSLSVPFDLSHVSPPSPTPPPMDKGLRLLSQRICEIAKPPVNTPPAIKDGDVKSGVATTPIAGIGPPPSLLSNGRTGLGSVLSSSNSISTPGGSVSSLTPFSPHARRLTHSPASMSHFSTNSVSGSTQSPAGQSVSSSSVSSRDRSVSSPSPDKDVAYRFDQLFSSDDITGFIKRINACLTKPTYRGAVWILREYLKSVNHPHADQAKLPHVRRICAAVGLVLPDRHEYISTTAPDGTKTFACPLCPNKVYRYRQGLYRHTRIAHTDTALIKCDICGKEFTSGGSLRLHKESVHFGIKHKCPLCNAEFTLKGSRRKHLRAVHNVEVTENNGTMRLHEID